MSSIFISHSSKDNESAKKLRDFLIDQEYQGIFLDFHPENGIPAGRDWVKELHTQLRKCQAVMLLLSKDFVKSQWCFAEVSFANSLPKPLFPIKLDNVSEEELETLQPLLNNTQTVDVVSDGWEEALKRLKRGLIAKGLDPKNLFEWKSDQPPYPGLSSFQREDAAVFFGRTDEIEESIDLLNRMRRHNLAKMAVILGASGSGKSSLMRAGLLPKLEKNNRNWLVVEPFRSLNNPKREFTKAIVSTFKRYSLSKDYAHIRSILTNAIEGKELTPLFDLIDELRITADSKDSTLLISVDQFEELIGAGTSEEQARFVEFLRHLIEKKDQIILLSTLRSDFLGIFQQHSALQDFTFESQTIGPISMRSIADVIEKPAEKAGLKLGAGLVQRILHDTKVSTALPLLAFTLRELYERFGGEGELKIQNYKELGGLQSAIIKAADDLLDTFVKETKQGKDDSEKQLLANIESTLKTIFLLMVRINEEGQYARRPVSEDKLAGLGISTNKMSLLERFIEARLLTKEKKEEELAPMLEVAHEALFTTWPRLKKWLDESHSFLLWRRHLEFKITLWEQHNKKKEYLLTLEEQQETRQLLNEPSYSLNQEELEFIERSEQEIGLEQIIISKAQDLIAHSSERTVYNWLKALISSGKPTEALEETKFIESLLQKSKALMQVVIAFANAKQPQLALQAAQSIKGSLRESVAFMHVAIAFAKAEQSQLAFQTVQAIEEASIKFKALMQVTETFMKAEQPQLA
ncbi:MAG: toll/interleukin-1 receptor domain-containing protein, partial [Cyclobacteriaceae bacterium]